MASLTTAQVLLLAIKCAPAMDPQMMIAIGQSESGLDPLTIHDNTTHQIFHGNKVANLAPQLIAAGHSLDLGLMQINSNNLAMLGLPLQNVFDECHSIRAAAQLLTLFSRYNTGSPTAGIANGYATRVMANLDKLKTDDVAVEQSSAAEPTCDRTLDVWADDPCKREDAAFTNPSEDDHDRN